MRQFVGRVRDDIDGARPARRRWRPPAVRGAGAEVDAAELAMMERDDEPTQLRYAQALADWGDAGGYDAEVLWDVLHARRSASRSSGPSGARCARCPAASRSGWCSRRCCAGPTRCCCSTSRTTTSTSPASAGSRSGCASHPKTVLFVSATTASCWPARRPGSSPSSRRRRRVGARRRVRDVPRGPGRPARPPRGAAAALGRGARAAQGAGAHAAAARRRTTTDMASRVPGDADPAAQVRGGRARPRRRPREQNVRDAAAAAAAPASGRSSASELELTGLMQPFDLEVWLRRAGRRARAATARASRTSCGCSRGGSDPDASTAGGDVHAGRHAGREARRAGRPGLVRPDPRPPGAASAARCSRSCTAATTTAAAWAASRRAGALDRYELGRRPSRRFETLSGGQQARFQILLLRAVRAPPCCCSTSRPTTSTCASAEALEEGLAAFEGTVLAVTHDRWFARAFDRFLVFGADGRVVRVPRAGLGRGPGRARAVSCGCSASALADRAIKPATRASTVPAAATQTPRVAAWSSESACERSGTAGGHHEPRRSPQRRRPATWRGPVSRSTAETN